MSCSTCENEGGCSGCNGGCSGNCDGNCPGKQARSVRVTARFLYASSVPVDEAGEDAVALVVARFLYAKGTGRGWEHRKEQDERAENNIPAEFLLLWKKLKPRFKGTPDQRAEQFIEYIEEHPGENAEFLQQHADKELAKATREWERQQKEQQREEDKRRKEREKQEKQDDWCRHNCPGCGALTEDAPF